jgi:hypothetical protein
MRFGLFGVLLVAGACVTGRVAISPGPIDWESVNDRWSVHVLTEDENGDERRTRLWIALLDGEGTLRAGGGRWAVNMKRERIDAAFREKYGWQDWLVEAGGGHGYFIRLAPTGAD